MSTQTDTRSTFEDVAILAGIPALIAGFIGVAVVVGAWSAFVVSKLYGWFVVPLGAPVLSWWHIFGLLLIYHMVTYKHPENRERPKDPHPVATMIGQILARVVGIALVLLIGWFVHGQAA